MKNKTSIVAGLIGIGAAAAAYLITYNVWVAFAGLIFGLFLAVALRPFYQGFFERRPKELPTTISVLRERGFEEGAPEERVFYSLIITQDIMLDVADPAQKAILDDIFAKSTVAMSEKYDFFRNRYRDVEERQMPVKICVGTCGAKMSTVGRCYRDWLKHVRIDNTTIPAKENIDVFFNDIQFTDTEGVARSAVVAVQFYRW